MADNNFLATSPGGGAGDTQAGESTVVPGAGVAEATGAGDSPGPPTGTADDDERPLPDGHPPEHESLLPEEHDVGGGTDDAGIEAAASRAPSGGAEPPATLLGLAAARTTKSSAPVTILVKPASRGADNDESEGGHDALSAREDQHAESHDDTEADASLGPLEQLKSNVQTAVKDVLAPGQGAEKPRDGEYTPEKEESRGKMVGMTIATSAK